MSTEHSPVAPAVAVGPYTVRETNLGAMIYAADGGALATVYLPSGDGFVGTPRERFTEATASAMAQAEVFAASWDLLAACEETAEALRTYAEVDAAWLTLEHASDLRAALLSAITKARGLRPCDVSALVPEVLQAQPQCVHGEKVEIEGFDRLYCLAHFGNRIRIERHEHPSNGGVWYTYVCDGFLEEQKESVE